MVPTSIAVAVLFSTSPLTDALLARHLAAWEKTAASSATYVAQYELILTQAHFNKKMSYTGSVAFRKPDLVRMNSQSARDTEDDVLYLFDGKSYFFHDSRRKEVWEAPLTKNASSKHFVATFMLKGIKQQFELFEFIHNFKVAEATQRYRIQLVKPLDANYVYLNLKPIAAADAVRSLRPQRLEALHAIFAGRSANQTAQRRHPALEVLQARARCRTGPQGVRTRHAPGVEVQQALDAGGAEEGRPLISGQTVEHELGRQGEENPLPLRERVVHERSE